MHPRPQGLFERHKLIFATQLCMAVLRGRGELQRPKFEFLLAGPKQLGGDNPLRDWVSDSVWGSVAALRQLDDYAALPDDLVGSNKRWREWMELERPGIEGEGRAAARAVMHARACMRGNLWGAATLQQPATSDAGCVTLTCAHAHPPLRARRHRAALQRTSRCRATGSACPSLTACCSSARCGPTA